MNTDSFLELLKYKLENELPGEESHVKMAPLSRPLTSLALQGTTEIRDSGVAIILYEDSPNVIHCVLIQRQTYEGSHSGQVSFPGGKKESGDITTEYTARRECFEEIGIALKETDLLGRLTNVYIPVSGFLVDPYVYYYQEALEFKLDPREVAEVLSFPLLLLKDESIVNYIDMEVAYNIHLKDVPYFTINDKVVWGATAIILSELKDILLSMN